ncbi:atp4 subunit B of the stator stalk of mitochondrial F1F0 ATP synthase [Chytridiales sp. JEL 0842]|nr:atp4 subunit B of the stator stalk of mitochondrial F1F0 ATP synthase [Chytridiales sp. JEL 0842]
MLLTRAASVSARQLQRAAVLPSVVRPVAGAVGQDRRLMATDSKKSPTETAQSLINLFPGSTPAAKASSVLLTSSIAAYLISKEIYILDGEVFEMACILGAYYIWYSSAKEGAVEYFNDRQNTIRNVLNKAREEHKAVVQERIAHIGKLADVVDVTKGLFAISKDIAKLEAQVYELKQKVAFSNEVRSVLDSWVRHEAGVREREQKMLTESVIAKIKAQLADPKTQNAILTETVAQVEKLTAKA